MTSPIDNCITILDWDAFLKSLGTGIKKQRDPWMWVNPDSDPNFEVTPDMEMYVNETKSRLGDYNFNGTCWYIYRPEEHIENNVIETLSKHFNITPTMANAYRVEPGCNCPIHIDPQITDDNWKKLKRYTWQFNKSSIGQILVIGDTAIHMPDTCDVYEWNSVDELHGATNIGGETAYYFLLEGIPND